MASSVAVSGAKNVVAFWALLLHRGSLLERAEPSKRIFGGMLTKTLTRAQSSMISGVYYGFCNSLGCCASGATRINTQNPKPL
jgi:hypothetical protein